MGIYFAVSHVYQRYVQGRFMVDTSPIVFVWDNFGPPHADRMEAVAEAWPDVSVLGVELRDKSLDYDWESERGRHFRKIPLSVGGTGSLAVAAKLASTLLRLKPRAVFFCHYERPEILIVAWVLRLSRSLCFCMNDSKFDDYPRYIWREFLKRFFFTPYFGAIVASPRSADYLRFLGVPPSSIMHGYDAISMARIQRLAEAEPAPAGVDFADRHFTIVSRLLPKKNISLALDAYALLLEAGSRRRLIICGSGPLEADLRAQAHVLGIEEAVEFRGFVQTKEVAAVLASTLALILPSTEEQFGQVIAEAIAMGVPVLVSDNCGARDTLVRTAINGFVFEPDNSVGLSRLMLMVSQDSELWRSLSEGTESFRQQADVASFVSGVGKLLEGRI